MSDTYAVTYRVHNEESGRPAGAVISSRQVLRDGDEFTMAVNLSNARSRGMEDSESIPRIVAIAHPGAHYITPEQVEVLSVSELAH